MGLKKTCIVLNFQANLFSAMAGSRYISVWTFEQIFHHYQEETPMLRVFGISALTLSLLTPAFAAQPASTSSQQSHTFFGIKGGFMKPDGENNDSALNIGAVIGQPVSRYFSWEAELNTTLADGEVGNNQDWDITNIAGYAVYRSEGSIGFKAKAGLTYWDADVPGDDGDMSLTMGIGAGFKMGQSGMLDVEYTQIDDFVDYISVGYLFNF